MTLWSNTDANSSAPKYKATATSNLSCQQAYQNVTPNGIVSHTALGVFAVNGNGMHSGQVTAPGWVEAKQYTGPIASIAVANDGASYANLALGLISNGTVNATFYVTVNSIGHVQTAVLVNAGADFINSSAVGITAPANGVATFTIGGGSGYANGEVVTVSNGAANATFSITTNATGGITSLTAVAPGYAGRGFAAANSTAAVVAIATANGTNGNVSVNSIGAGAGFTATVTLGGRGGRVNYETLVVSKYVSVTSNSALFTA